MVDPSIDFSLKEKLGGRNLYLVGMMGSGKSYTGPLLAKTLDYAFVDSDLVIEKASGKTIQEIFDLDQEKGFRKLEHQVLSEIGQHHSLVVATGGGVVTIPENWSILHQGIVIWIETAREIALERLHSQGSKRPLLSSDELEKDFDYLFSQRKALYAESDLHVNIGAESGKEVTDKILINLESILIPRKDLNEPRTS